MKMITKAIEKQLPALYATDGQKEKTAVTKFFNPCGGHTWFVVEGEQKESGDWLFFGLVDSGDSQLGAEWGYFTLSELQSVRLPFGMKIERDRYFSAQTVSR